MKTFYNKLVGFFIIMLSACSAAADSTEHVRRNIFTSALHSIKYLLFSIKPYFIGIIAVWLIYKIIIIGSRIAVVAFSLLAFGVAFFWFYLRHKIGL